MTVEPLSVPRTQARLRLPALRLEWLAAWLLGLLWILPLADAFCD